MRHMYIKRGPQKRPTEFFKLHLVCVLEGKQLKMKEPPSFDRTGKSETYVHQKETYTYRKRPIHIKRDLYSQERDLFTSREKKCSGTPNVSRENTLKLTTLPATHYNTLQHTTIHYNALQYNRKVKRETYVHQNKLTTTPSRPCS